MSKKHMRSMTPADWEKIRAYHDGKIQLPSWITQWNEKIEDATRRFAAGRVSGAITPELEPRIIKAIVNMKRRKDYLYRIWMDEQAFKTWEDLSKERPPTREDLFTYTVEDTEDFLNGPGVPAFVLFLNDKWPGIMREFSHTLLRSCDPLLAGFYTLTPQIRRTFAYPKEVFATDNAEVLEARLLKWAETVAPDDSAPNFVHRIFEANLMVALGNELGACTRMEFARCEAAEPGFPQLMEIRSPRTDELLFETQWWQIDVLLSLWPSD